VGQGREVILEGGKRPGEERPNAGVNNAIAGERIRSKVLRRRKAWITEQLKSSKPKHRKMGNGREDSSIREGPAAASGEKPLKGGYPGTIRPERRSADSRHGRNRGRQPRSVGERRKPHETAA